MSPSSWTLPSHASLFWGVYPSAFRTEEPNHWKMPDARPLAESLRNVGYLTAAFTGGGFVSAGFGFARGFDEYYMYQDGSTTGACPPERFDGPTVFRRAGEWIRQHSGAPFFLFVHTYDVHDMCPFRVGLSPFAQVPDPGPEGRRRHGEHYRNLVTSTDALFASLLGEIDAQGLTDNTLVILTSDHGEGFWEHGFRGHGVGVRLHEELIHVPLMLRFPARLKAGGIVPQPVSLVDVAPTILALLGLPTEKTMQGLPLPGVGLNYPVQDQLSAAVFRRLQRDPGPVSELLGSWLLRPVFVQTVDSLAVRTARYKMLTFPADPAIEVFDLAQDPAERTNVAAAIPSVERNLRKQATAYWQRRVASGTDGHAPVEIDERTREQLRALGYTQ